MTGHSNKMTSSPVTPQLPGIRDENDEDLLVLMSLRADDPGEARAAGEEFYRRHVEYMYGVCCKAYRSRLKNQGLLEDLLQETFRQAYEQAGSFDPTRIVDRNDKEAVTRVVRAWLGSIAHRLFLDLFVGQKEAVQQDQEYWQDVPERIAQESPDGELNVLVQQALQTALTDREREILLDWLDYYDPERDHQRVPNEVAKTLAKRFGTTTEYVRKIRQRALKKVEDYIINALGHWPFRG